MTTCRVSNSYEVKVADFGLARDLNADEYEPITKIPLKWMPIEILRNLDYRSFTTKCDVVSS